jgi:glycosyltransferase involved in cell wall biosynthesis
LRVVVLGRSFYGLHGYGGLERHLYDLVRHHLAEGWHVTVVTRTPGDRAGVDPQRWRVLSDHPACDVRFVDYRTFPLAGRAGTTILDRSTAYPWFGRRAGRLAAEFVASGKADVIYGVGASVWGYAKARRGGAGAPLVFNPQGLEEFGGMDGSYGGHALKSVGYAPLRAVVRDCAAAADAVIATDQAIVPAVLQHLRVGQDRVHLVPNGIDVGDLDGLVDPAAGRAARRHAGITDDEAVLVSVGRLEANKGFADLAEALAHGALTAGWRWVLVGDGPERGRLQALVDRLRIADRVRLVGPVDDDQLHAWYDAADLFVHPTRYEGSSLVTLEAMLHKRPVVATRAGGLPDKVVPGRTGWLTEPSTPSALTATLQQAFAERERWPAYGEAGRALLEEVFDWRAIQRRFSALYGALTGR